MRNLRFGLAGLALLLVLASFACFGLSRQAGVDERAGVLGALVLMAGACWCWALVALAPSAR
jgi:hypothetical protein